MIKQQQQQQQQQQQMNQLPAEEYDLEPIQIHQRILKERKVKNYQIFPGNTRFLCGGRLVTSKDYRAFIAALLIFITPVVLFCIFTCPFLWNEVHPAIPIIFAYLFILAFASMLKTSWTDPGIIPRNLDTQEEIEENASSINPSIISGIYQKEIQIKNTSWSLKYCDTCKIYRPPRASHCRQCDNCVEYEDHHCIWLNNCVVWMVGGLTVYHCLLIMRGVTTHEQLRSDILKLKYPDLGVNPYNKKSPFKNMAQVLCQPQPKSYLRRRKMADPIIEKI
ncbi:hypothetical protein G6F62_010643 [Rhizopus arrhizus]|nr:hypothetical protein G6F62_010643 [Rhizopus arrhizus]